MLANMPSPPEDAPPNRIYKDNDVHNPPIKLQFCKARKRHIPVKFLGVPKVFAGHRHCN